MGVRVGARVRALLDEAEARGECLAIGDRAIQAHLRYLHRRGLVTRVLPGAYAWRETWSGLNTAGRHLRLIRTASRQHPDWVFCGPSAALLHGLSVSYSDLGTLHVAERGSRHRSTKAVTWHWTGRCDVVRIDGVPATTFERTTFDCLRSLSFPHALAIADSSVRVSGRNRTWLERVVGRMRSGYRGAAQARLVASLANGLAESGGESVARATMIEQGFVIPELQSVIRDRLGGRSWRVDFLWRLPSGTRVAGELDGRQKYVDPVMTGGRSAVDVMADERLRESRLTAEVAVMRFSYADATRNHGRQLVHIMESFGIPRPRGYRSFDLRPRGGARRDRGIVVLAGWRVRASSHARAA